AFLTRRRARWTLAPAAAGTAAVIAITALGSSYVDARVHKDEQLTRRTVAKHPRCFGAAARDPAHQPCENPSLAFTVVPTPLEATKKRNSSCDVIERLDRVRVCAFGPSPAKSTDTIALVGDSHASHWRAALQVVADAK